jgi:alkyldihydroxyacetonephosphate synthase
LDSVSHCGGVDILAGLTAALGHSRLIDVSETARAAHACDWWPLAAKWRQLGWLPYQPDVVVYPETTQDVSAILAWANAHGVAVTAWGLGSSVVGQPLATRGGISLDLSRMDRIIAVDERDLVARVEAGVAGGKLEQHLNGLGYTLHHSPQSLHRSTVGGWVATRATGQFSSRYGGIEELCYALTAVLADGSIVTTAAQPRMSVGPDLRHLFIGSEGCFGVITEVALRIFPVAEARSYEVVDLPSVDRGIEAMRDIMAVGLKPFLLRFYDRAEARHATQDPDYASPVMFLGCEGSVTMAQAELEACRSICARHGGECRGPEAVTAWMSRRYDFSTIESYVGRPEGVAETIEVAGNWSTIGATYRALTERLKPLATEVLGHFSHTYTTGTSLYVILLGNAESALAAEATLREIWKVSMETALETGAAISHHHGAGLARAPYITDALGGGIDILQRWKAAFDPNGILNPGKLGLDTPPESREANTEGKPA